MDTPPTAAQLAQAASGFKCPALAGISNPTGINLNLHFVRTLTEEENTLVAKYTKEAAVARNRFKLFRILNRNYEEWVQYTSSLLVLQPGLTETEMLELDRLMLNFLTSARSLIDHFAQHYKQTFRKTPSEEKYAEYIAKLETNSWAFAFFQDFRNYTQHCGLPIGRYSREASRHAVNLKIVAGTAWLLKNYDKWSKSELKERFEKGTVGGELDLIELTQEYWVRLNQDLGRFVGEAFIPTIQPAHDFLAGLAREVEAQKPGATFSIIESYSVEPNGIKWTKKTPPADLFGSLGIVPTPTTTAKSGDAGNIKSEQPASPTADDSKVTPAA